MSQTHHGYLIKVLSVLCLAAAAACDPVNRVTSIEYIVSEYRGRSSMSCIATGTEPNAQAAGAMSWAVGTALSVTVAARYEQGCLGWFGDCPPTEDFDIVPVAPEVWMVELGPEPGSSFGPNGRHVVAAAPGVGGLRVEVESGLALPELSLRAVALKEIRFGLGPTFTSTAVTELDPRSRSAPEWPTVQAIRLKQGEAKLVMPYLIDEAGNRSCGVQEATVTPTGGISVDEFANTGFGLLANMPFVVQAESPGQASLRVQAQQVAGELGVEVTP